MFFFIYHIEFLFLSFFYIFQISNWKALHDNHVNFANWCSFKVEMQFILKHLSIFHFRAKFRIMFEFNIFHLKLKCINHEIYVLMPYFNYINKLICMCIYDIKIESVQLNKYIRVFKLQMSHMCFSVSAWVQYIFFICVYF